MAKILTSPGKYVQGAGELKKLGTYAKTYGITYKQSFPCDPYCLGEREVANCAPQVRGNFRWRRQHVLGKFKISYGEFPEQ